MKGMIPNSAGNWTPVVQPTAVVWKYISIWGRTLHSGEHLREATRLKWECIWRRRYIGIWCIMKQLAKVGGGGEGMNSTCIDMWGHDSSVSTVTMLFAEEEWGSGFCSKQRQIFSFLKCPDWLWVSFSVLYRRNVSGGKATGAWSSPLAFTYRPS
jgi:hypothetical protein